MLGLGNHISSTYEHLYSLNLDGTDDYVRMGDVLDFGTVDFAISMWVKMSANHDGLLLCKKEDNSNRILISCTGKAGKIYVLANSGGTNVISYFGGTGITALLDTWVHICFTADRSDVANLYINGSTSTYGFADVDISGESSRDLDNTGYLEIGRQGTSNYYNGKITDVAVWQNAYLNSDAVTEIYNSGKPFDLRYNRGNYTRAHLLIGYWRTNDGRGAVVKDYGSGGNDGTLNGAGAYGDGVWNSDTPDD